jgi:hypothetical protein
MSDIKPAELVGDGGKIPRRVANSDTIGPCQLSHYWDFPWRHSCSKTSCYSLLDPNSCFATPPEGPALINHRQEAMLQERRKLTEKKVVKSASSVNPGIPKKLFTL